MKSVVVLSGGMDSSVLAYWSKDQGDQVVAITVLYGQRHVKELDAARVICDRLGIKHEVADLGGAAQLFAGSALTGTGEVPHGHYADESMKKTVVPNRNMVLLSLGIALAVREKAQRVLYGAHSGDHAIYPDCRPEYFRAMGQAAMRCDWEPIHLEAPFMDRDKAAIASLGNMLKVPFQETWSCYEGGELHCGKCGTCVERREAFQLANVSDPTMYREA